MKTSTYARMCVFLVVLTMALAVSCMGPSRFGEVEKILPGDLGRLTFEAAKDRWGEPKSVSQGEGSFTALWEHERGLGVSERLALTFSSRTNLLKAYNYQQRPFE